MCGVLWVVGVVEDWIVGLDVLVVGGYVCFVYDDCVGLV